MPHTRRFTVFLTVTSFLAALALISCVAGCGGSESQESDAQRRFITIGTGGVTGVYYPAGGAIARLVNDGTGQHGIRASYEATGGSVYNINAILAGDMDIGIAQSDRQYQAYHGLAEWEERGGQAKLRSICSLHAEMVTLVAAVDAGVSTLADLRGKRVNIGNPGSGQRGNALDVLRTAGIDPAADFHAEGLKAAESAQMLQDGRIDAFFYTVGHPAGAITEATAGQRRKVRLIPISGMQALLDSAPYYTKQTIARAHYPGADNAEDVPTIGVKTTIVTSLDIPEDVVYVVTKAVFANLDDFKGMHAAFQELAMDEMLAGLSAPVHPGAMRYYVEAGLAERVPEALRP